VVGRHRPMGEGPAGRGDQAYWGRGYWWEFC